MEEEDQRKTIPEAQKTYFKQEFLTIMQERFMSGQDQQFDYRLEINHVLFKERTCT